MTTKVRRGGVLLLPLLVALLTRHQGTAAGQQQCDWESPSDPEQGLDPRSLEAGARHLDYLPAVTDAAGCQDACCAHPECQIAMLGTPADDGTPQCFLVGCMSGEKDVCELRKDNQFRVYLRKATRREEAEPLSSRPTELPKVEDEDKNSTNTDRCRLRKEVGPCRAAFPRHYYDLSSQGCKTFTYGGCGDNGNNFETREECETACSGVTGPVLESTPPLGGGAARRMLPLPADQIPELSKDVESETKSEASPPESEPKSESETEPKPESEPEPKSESEPELAATPPPATPADDPESSSTKAPLPEMASTEFAERCEAGPVVGPCRAALRHWYYNSETSACKTFLYGGCRGNKNNYADEQSCMATCTVTVIPSSRMDPAESEGPNDQAAKDYREYCAVASETGPCKAAFSMFYYQPSTGSCQAFLYGGCKGNSNRYETLEDCLARCSGKEGRFSERGHNKKRWTPAPFFLVAALAVISALLLAALVLITLRRSRLQRQPATSVSDKEELLPEELSSMESLSVEGSPKVGKA